jgi:hypothetical protein
MLIPPAAESLGPMRTFRQLVLHCHLPPAVHPTLVSFGKQILRYSTGIACVVADTSVMMQVPRMLLAHVASTARHVACGARTRFREPQSFPDLINVTGTVYLRLLLTYCRKLYRKSVPSRSYTLDVRALQLALTDPFVIFRPRLFHMVKVSQVRLGITGLLTYIFRSNARHSRVADMPA